jgi:ribose 5-phosphate isomerase B
MTDSSAKLRIVLGADHAGFRLKESIKKYLQSEGHAVDDVGTMSEESVDYPDVAAGAAHRVADGHDDLGIVVCGTGIGVTIAANKVAGIRAALVCDPATAHLAREHNDANVLALAGRVLKDDQAMHIVREFLATPFAGGRHERRIEKIAQLDRAREQNNK